MYLQYKMGTDITNGIGAVGDLSSKYRLGLSLREANRCEGRLG